MAVSDPPPERRHRSKPPKATRPWYLQVGWMLAFVLMALLAGLVMGFIWATTRDYSTLAANGAEIRQLTRQVHQLRHQLAFDATNHIPKNWWGWWFSAPFRRLWLSLHL